MRCKTVHGNHHISTNKLKENYRAFTRKKLEDIRVESAGELQLWS